LLRPVNACGSEAGWRLKKSRDDGKGRCGVKGVGKRGKFHQNRPPPKRLSSREICRGQEEKSKKTNKRGGERNGLKKIGKKSAFFRERNCGQKETAQEKIKKG